MKIFFFVIAIFLIIIMVLNTKLIEGINVPTPMRQTRSSGSPIKSIGIRSVTGNIGRVSTSADYTHKTPTTTSSWNSHSQQWNS